MSTQRISHLLHTARRTINRQFAMAEDVIEAVAPGYKQLDADDERTRHATEAMKQMREEISSIAQKYGMTLEKDRDYIHLVIADRLVNGMKNKDNTKLIKNIQEAATPENDETADTMLLRQVKAALMALQEPEESKRGPLPSQMIEQFRALHRSQGFLNIIIGSSIRR